jgi:hypothetical protein
VREGVEPTRRFRLRTTGGVLTELARCYRAAWSGTLTWQDAAAAARILREIRNTIEGDDIERRVSALEEQLDGRRGARPNGEARPWP